VQPYFFLIANRIELNELAFIMDVISKALFHASIVAALVLCVRGLTVVASEPAASSDAKFAASERAIPGQKSTPTPPPAKLPRSIILPAEWDKVDETICNLIERRDLRQATQKQREFVGSLSRTDAANTARFACEKGQLAEYERASAGDVKFQSHYLDALHNMFVGVQMHRQARILAAWAALKCALADLKLSVGDEVPSAAVLYEKLADCEAAFGEMPVAVAYYMKALKLSNSFGPRDDPNYTRLQVVLATALTATKRFDEAEAALREATENDRKVCGEISAEYAFDLLAFATLYVAKDKLCEAEALDKLAEAVKTAVDPHWQDGAFLSRLLINQVAIYVRRDQFDRAERLLSAKLSDCKGTYLYPALCTTHSSILRRLGRMKEADQVAEESRKALAEFKR